MSYTKGKWHKTPIYLADTQKPVTIFDEFDEIEIAVLKGKHKIANAKRICQCVNGWDKLETDRKRYRRRNRHGKNRIDFSDKDEARLAATIAKKAAQAEIEEKREHLVAKDMDDIVYEFIDELDFDFLKPWAAMLDVEYEEPPIDDMWTDWEGELRGEMQEAMLKLSQK